MKVKAAVARSAGDLLQLEGLTLAEPQPDEVLVKMIACGVAQADLDAIDGRPAMPFPFVPGSEGAGIVERVGDKVTSLAPGDAIVIGFDYCGQCPACNEGRPRRCAAFAARNLAGQHPDARSPYEERDINGHFFGQSSFATHVVCRASRATKLAKGSPLEALACLGGDFLIGAGTVLRAFDLRAGDSLLVHGANVIGLAATMIARSRGAGTIIVVEPNETHRTLASELGGSVVLHPDDNLADLIKSIAADGVRFAIDATGTSRAQQVCAESLIDMGVCAVVGSMGEHEISRAVRVVLAEDYASPASLIPELAVLHGRGDLPLEKLIDFFPFEQVNDAIEALRSRAVAKPVLRFSIGAFGDLDRAQVDTDHADVPAEPSHSPADETVESASLVKS